MELSRIYSYFYHMAKKKPKLESVKINSKSVDRVRENKKKTRIPIAAFIEEAIDEKFKRQNGL